MIRNNSEEPVSVGTLYRLTTDVTMRLPDRAALSSSGVISYKGELCILVAVYNHTLLYGSRREHNRYVYITSAGRIGTMLYTNCFDPVM
jgi:hypothetical protein